MSLLVTLCLVGFAWGWQLGETPQPSNGRVVVVREGLPDCGNLPARSGGFGESDPSAPVAPSPPSTERNAVSRDTA